MQLFFGEWDVWIGGQMGEKVVISVIGFVYVEGYGYGVFFDGFMGVFLIDVSMYISYKDFSSCQEGQVVFKFSFNDSGECFEVVKDC